VRENVHISHRGRSYEIGRGPGFCAIWTFGAPDLQPAEWWPETADGWAAAWARFVFLEGPKNIVAVTQFPPPPDSPPSSPVYEFDAVTTPRTKVAAALLLIGVALGLIALFPSYIGGKSLVSQADQYVPHLFYLVAWGASAALILARRRGLSMRLGAFVAAGTSFVAFGYFFSDVGAVIDSGTHVMGAGLVLGVLGWIVCAAGSVVALRVRPHGGPAKPSSRDIASILTVVVPAVGVAITFAPSWDHYTLSTSSGASQSITVGNAFSNPAALISGNLIVMVALVAIVVVVALWRPVVLGAALLAGAIIPMVAQAVSAFVQLGETTPGQFGISAAQASHAGLTIHSGLTLDFWIYCAFLVALIAGCIQLFLAPRPIASTPIASIPTPMVTPTFS
jgi:hypothetical protein